MTLRRLATLTVLALTACGGGAPADKPAEGGGEPAKSAKKTRGTLVAATQSDIGYLGSVVYEAAADSQILTNLSFPIVDPDFDCSLKKAPGLAKSWEWSEDGKVLKMELRDDIKWADGKPVTVEDISFTYDLIADPNVASPRRPYIEYMVEGKRPLVVDSTHIEWHFTRAYDRDTQVAHTGLTLMPKHIFGDADRKTLRGHPRINEPLSYGPFKLANRKPNESFVLEPNEHFSGPEHWQANLNRVIFRVIPEYSTRLIELESGKIDFMESILVEDADRLRETHKDINLVRRGWRSNDYVAWNLENELFKSKKVRKALALSIDIDKIIGKVLTSKTGESYARRSVGTITPALCGVHNNDLQPLPHNTERAKKLFAEAGWTDSDGDGILDKGGKKFSFTLTTNTGNKRRANSAVLIQAQLKAVGVEVNIEQTESNSFFENLRKRDYEAALSGWAAGLFVDPSGIWGCDKPDKKNEFNFTGYCNAKVDELIDKGLNTPNPKDAAPIWKDMQEQIYDDQPYLFLWWMDEIVAIHNRFDNTHIDMLSRLNRLHEWEVAPDKVKYKR